jgi:hypothetical protein
LNCCSELDDVVELTGIANGSLKPAEVVDAVAEPGRTTELLFEAVEVGGFDACPLAIRPVPRSLANDENGSGVAAAVCGGAALKLDPAAA